MSHWRRSCLQQKENLKRFSAKEITTNRNVLNCAVEPSGNFLRALQQELASLQTEAQYEQKFGWRCVSVVEGSDVLL